MEQTQDERGGLFDDGLPTASPTSGCADNPALAPPTHLARERSVHRLIAACEACTFLKVTPTLAELASDYGSLKGRPRPSADPVGIAGLPDTRADLNALLMHLCRRLVVAGGGPFLKGRRLVSDLRLENERALRLLVAYGRVHHHIRPIVGIYGQGYCWADLADNPAAVYALARGQAVSTARCHLFLSTLFGRDDGAMGLVQMVFPFATTAPADDLAALLTAKGIGHEQVLEAMIAHCRQAGEEGVAAIRRVAARNQDVLIPADRLAAMRRQLQSVLDDLPEARPEIAPATPR